MTMNMHWTFGRKLALGFSIPILILGIVSLVGHRSMREMNDNDAWVRHTYEVQKQLDGMLAYVVDAETGHRGYLITGKPEFLRPYEEALPRIGRAVDEVARLTADNPEQQQRLSTRLRPALAAKLVEMARVLQARRDSGAEAAASRVAEGTGRLAMDELRAVVAEMERDEEALLATRRQSADIGAARARAVLLIGPMLGLALVAVVGWLISGTLARQVSTAVIDIRGSATELQAAAHQQAAAAKQQASAMTEIATTMSELLVTSRQIAEIAERVTGIAARASGATELGRRTVVRGNEAAATMKRDVETLVGQMGNLAQKADRIEGVLDLVSELAKQTNILAINATIEAVGAAEAGQRFGVVAEEIRRLADRVGGSTKEVRTLLDDVRGAVATATQSTDSGSRAVAAGARQFDDISGAFQQISTEVSTSTEAAKEIGLSTKQQASAIEQVNLAIASAAQATRETEASSGQTLKTAEALLSLSGGLLQLVEADGDGSRANGGARHG
ncbi:MAG: CHASE3 domain-containing protein [Polyangiaceae bacterium]